MKSAIITSFLFLQFFCACNSGEGTDEDVPPSENAEDAARNFIRAVLDSDFMGAGKYMIGDSANQQYLELARRSRSAEDRHGYRGSSIRIHEVRTVNDSTSIVYYSNSYKNQNDSLKVVNRGGQWLVDLQYTFNGDRQANAVPPTGGGQ